MNDYIKVVPVELIPCRVTFDERRWTEALWSLWCNKIESRLRTRVKLLVYSTGGDSVTCNGISGAGDSQLEANTN